ncbi:MAG: 2-phospho-L-lactate transferase [Acidimicrobiia bacterium]|nr:2-phospho-L-lactate transferase [Acidimicrobiia bacterium]
MSDRNPTLLSGGVGGARMARALVEAGVAPTIIVNVGDDDVIHGVHVSADIDTVAYTLAGIQGSQGWGIADDTWTMMDHLSALGIDTSFRLGDRDLAFCLARTEMLRAGATLSDAVSWLTATLGIRPTLMPATDDRLRTIVHTAEGHRLGFQEYFVTRGHSDIVAGLEFDGADSAKPAPGVIDSIARAPVVVIAPSNPPLSIWPILAVSGIREALVAHPRVVAVSPLFAGRAKKGPADAVLESLGLGTGTGAVLEAYSGIIDTLVVDVVDSADESLTTDDVAVVSVSTDLATSGVDFATWLMEQYA